MNREWRLAADRDFVRGDGRGGWWIYSVAWAERVYNEEVGRRLVERHNAALRDAENAAYDRAIKETKETVG